MKEKYRDREKKSVCFSQRLIEMGTLGQQGEVCVCVCVCLCVCVEGGESSHAGIRLHPI